MPDDDARDANLLETGQIDRLLAKYQPAIRRPGEGADELARLIDGFVRVVPAPEPSEDDVAVMCARLEGEPGLLTLRTRRKRKVDEVVAGLAERLEIENVPRLKRYYQRLEGATLDP